MDSIKSLPVITLGQIIERIEGEAIVVLCLIAALPFMQPIPIPGLSSILGSVILLQGVGLLFFGKPLLTNKMRRMVISHERFSAMQRAASKFSYITSKLSTFKHSAVSSRVSHMFCGLSIIFSASFLSLPLPIPFSNFIPALSIFLICIGLLEEDVILVLTGHMIAFTLVCMGVFSYHLILERVQSWP